jgi:DNA-binding NarL/FixJ family response regulator
MKNMKVLNINQEQLVSIGIQNILEKHFEDVQVMTSCDQQEILELIQEHSFDLVFMDIGITGIDTLKLMKLLPEQQQRAEVLILSNVEYKPYALKYISLGAGGFLDKTSSEKDFLMAIKLIRSGQLYLSKDMLMSLYNQNVSIKNNVTPFHKLSKRELEVFKLLIRGKRIKDISKIMQIHQSTTSTLKRRVLEKFKVDNLMKLKSMAMEYGY